MHCRHHITDGGHNGPEMGWQKYWTMLKIILKLFMGHKYKNTNQISYKVIALVIEIIVHSVFNGKIPSLAHNNLLKKR